jgi:predicted  nucleic acid-binding Zn-ribbon protein
MAKSKQPLSQHEETLDNLLDKVSNAREELVTIERTLERLRSDISKMQKRRDGSGAKQVEEMRKSGLRC